MSTDACLGFVPSGVEGLANVSEVTIYPDRLELIVSGGCSVIPFAKIARWPKPKWLWQLLSHTGFWHQLLPVADRDWFHPPADRYFRFYTDPPLKICMPVDEIADEYVSTYFVHTRLIVNSGGFQTNDLG
jgi:hypothetical protein